ncbi:MULTISPECIES: hypothetical protein [unclassified Mesorhizobium]|uniref:hypothetical protein n=1 Tax=unclassified Mesorhizobium TaxID=325217 RepID=UPI000F74FDA9|nr:MULTISPECIES: hypothetical protein [unclassified Mesorhizobium]AZO28500.1 hypothetical protein EJ071_14575 [Mesorhizobium sp. M1B.F.Ca.ET.045.04.1.1]RWB20909.1 MAG: hypothetical protein EOQ40_13475 [Mesorhizobium sp.]TIS49216.1 MAG: hypothetical protein E5W96_15920 [Mesorhizobium sp.]
MGSTACRNNSRSRDQFQFWPALAARNDTTAVTFQSMALVDEIEMARRHVHEGERHLRRQHQLIAGLDEKGLTQPMTP